MNKTDIGKYFGKKSTIIKQFDKSQLINGFVEEMRYIYVDNNAPVLLVAHMDTVQTPQLRRWNMGAGFDDRLGCFLGNQLVKKYPNYFDLLITDFEETCRSTAEFFKPSHDYNFIVELDREGEDYVDYGLCCDYMSNVLSAYGFESGWGSYTDIVELDMCHCSKINLGIGVVNSHQVNSWYDPSVVDRQLTKLMSFVRDFHAYHFEEEIPYFGNHRGNWKSWVRSEDGIYTPVDSSKERSILGTGGSLVDNSEEITEIDEDDWEEYYEEIKAQNEPWIGPNENWDHYHGYSMFD